MVVTAKDGFAIIRDPFFKKTGKTLKTGTVVFWESEYDGPGYLNGWFHIAYTDDAFSKNADETGKHLTFGLVHESQVTDLKQLNEVQAKSFNIQYKTKKFDYRGKKILFSEDKNYIKTVNGYRLFGADCGLPKTEIVKATATLESKKIEMPKDVLWNILGANGTFEYYKWGNTYYALQSNGDGGCAYYVVWVFKNGKLLQRLLGNMY